MRKLNLLALAILAFCSCTDENNGIIPGENSYVEIDFDNISMEGSIVAETNNSENLPVIKIPFANSNGATIHVKDVAMPGDLTVDCTLQLPIAEEGNIEIPVRNMAKLENVGENTLIFNVIHMADTTKVELDVEISKLQAVNFDFDNIVIPTIPGGESFQNLNITIPVECLRETSVNVSLSGLPEGVTFTENVVLTPTDEILIIPLSGIVQNIGDYPISLSLGFEDVEITKDINIRVIKLIKITSVQLSDGVCRNSSNDILKVTIGYENAESGNTLALDLDGFVALKDGVEISNPLSEGDGTVEFEIQPSQCDNSPITEETRYPSNQIFNIGLKYQGSPLTLDESISSVNKEIDGFIWNERFYRVITIGGQQWLDRNMGATSNNVAVPTLGTNNLISDWEYNFTAYGDYYQRGRKTGIPIQTDKCPATPFMVDNSSDRWGEGYWSLPEADISPSKPGVADFDSILSLWEKGGENFPAPPGFDVPSINDYNTLINKIDTDITEGNLQYKMMISDLKFPLSGAIQTSGPIGSTITTGIRGQVGMVGANGATNTNQSLDTSNTETLASQGQIWLLTKSYDDTSSNAAYVKCVRILLSTNATIDSFSFTANRTMSMPLRCIKR